MKRIHLLMALVGLAILVVSLVVWSQQNRAHKVFYSTNAYQWLPVSQVAGKLGPEERSWNFNANCAKPYFEKYLAKAEVNLSAHKAREPVHLLGENTTTALKEKIDWFETKSLLALEVDDAKRALSDNINRLIREGEIEAIVERNALYSQLVGPNLLSSSQKQTPEEQFMSSLFAEMNLNVLPDHDAQSVFKNCVGESVMRYVLLRTTYHTDIDDWPDDHPRAFFMGSGFLALGVLGWFGIWTLLWTSVMARLVHWIKTGKLDG